MALTFENQRPGAFVPSTVYKPELLTTHQKFQTHYNGGKVTVIDDPNQACKGRRFARATISGPQKRAQLNFNDAGGDLRAKATDWKVSRPDRWMGMCIRLAKDYPYPAPGWPVVWSTHCFSWVAGEPNCGPAMGLRAGASVTHGTGWELVFEGDSNRKYSLNRDLKQDRGVWRTLVIHWIAGSRGSATVWLGGTKAFSDSSESTYPDSARYFAYELPVGIYNTYCVKAGCPALTIDYDELRYANGAGLSEAQGYATVNPDSY